MLKTALGRLRVIALIEGVSFLLLLFIAMPLKYMASIPEPVAIIGMIHGVLFVLYILALLNAMIAYRWSILRGLIAFILASVPFGTFWLDRQWRREQEGFSGKAANVRG